MEFTNEFIEKNQLNENQVSELSTFFKTEHDKSVGEEVHNHVENSLEKVWNSVKEKVGMDREQGEKISDALMRVTPLYIDSSLAKEKQNLLTKTRELEQKVNETKGSDLLKSELEQARDELTALKQKEAIFAEWEENDYKGKYEKANQDLTSMQRKVAFSYVKPSFPETVNPFEVKAKWKDFQKTVDEKYNIVLDEDNEPWGVDKENEFKKFKLSELVAKDESLTELLKGRAQIGTGAKSKENIKIDGVPFDVPKDATPQERQKAIKEYLASQNITTISGEYPAKFAELNTRILGLEKKQA